MFALYEPKTCCYCYMEITVLLKRNSMLVNERTEDFVQTIFSHYPNKTSKIQFYLYSNPFSWCSISKQCTNSIVNGPFDWPRIFQTHDTLWSVKFWWIHQSLTIRILCGISWISSFYKVSPIHTRKSSFSFCTIMCVLIFKEKAIQTHWKILFKF